MTFLLDFIEAAQGDGSVPALLRRIKVLAAFTDTPELTQWAKREINGYPPEAPLPEYRGPIPVRPLGHFVGPFGSEIQNVPIPSFTFPKEWRDGPLFLLRLTQGIAEIEAHTVNDSTEFAWTADIVMGYNTMVEQGKISRIVDPTYGLVGAKFTVSRAQFVGVLDAIRNKALDLALELHSVAPSAGEATADPATKEAARTTIIQFFNFSNANLSGSNNALGSSSFEQGFGTSTTT
jgi:hypothetical protein